MKNVKGVGYPFEISTRKGIFDSLDFNVGYQIVRGRKSYIVCNQQLLYIKIFSICYYFIYRKSNLTASASDEDEHSLVRVGSLGRRPQIISLSPSFKKVQLVSLYFYSICYTKSRLQTLCTRKMWPNRSVAHIYINLY